MFGCSGCVRGSDFIFSCVRNSMFEKLDTGISCGKGGLPFPSELFKISSQLFHGDARLTMAAQHYLHQERQCNCILGVWGKAPLSDKRAFQLCQLSRGALCLGIL